MATSNYHLPALAMAGIALAASGYALSSTSVEKKKRRKHRARTMAERDGKYILGLVNTGNSCFVNSVLQAMATLICLRSYLAERVGEQEGESAMTVPPNKFILESVTFALYSTIEMLNKPLTRPRKITPVDIIHALEQKTKGSVSRDQQDAHELFQIISSVLTSEEDVQYKPPTPSLLDCLAVDQERSLDHLETSSISSVGTYGSMWSSFSVSTVGGGLRPRPSRPRNPFTGLAASKISCVKCNYTAPIRHHTFDNVSLTVPHQPSCTLESCLDIYTSIETLDDFQCRKCTLLSTLKALTKKLEQEDHSQLRIDEVKDHIKRVKHALQFDVESTLTNIPVTLPSKPSTVTKQLMFANPPKSLCLHLSRSIYHPSGQVQKNHCNVQFLEYLDLAPYSTTGFLNTSDPSAGLSSPSSQHCLPSTRLNQPGLMYLRNLASKNRHSPANKGLGAMLSNANEMELSAEEDAPVSFAQPMTSSVLYRLSAVIVHYGNHDSGHFVTFRRKKLPTGQDIRGPLESAKDRHTLEPTKFWRCNDETIEQVDLETVLASEAYMLFYERDDLKY